MEAFSNKTPRSHIQGVVVMDDQRRERNVWPVSRVDSQAEADLEDLA